MLKENEYIEVEMTFQELFEKCLSIKDFNVIENEVFDISKLGIKILSYDIFNKKEVWSDLENLVIKPKVKEHYEIKNGNEQIKVTGGHLTYFNDSYIETQSRLIQDLENVKIVDQEMFVVDCSVKDTECYFANGQLNHNSYNVPGGKAIPFYSSIRVYLESKTKIVIKDPTLELEFEKAMIAWKEAGGKKAGIEKPEKPKSNKDNETTVGYEVTAFTKKNKTAPSDRRSQFRIIFSQGLFDEECWFDLMIKYGIIKTTGHQQEIVAFPNDLGKFHKNDWIEILQKNELYYNKLKELLIDKLTIKFKFENYKIENEDIDLEEDDYSISKSNSSEEKD